MDQLIAAHNSKKLHHANLISGGAGEDPLPVALSLAAMLLCETEAACGMTFSCLVMESIKLLPAQSVCIPVSFNKVTLIHC